MSVMNGLGQKATRPAVQSIGEIIREGIPRLVKPSGREKCVLCGQREATSVLHRCPVCHRRTLYESLPAQELEAVIATVVPQRYLPARLEHLAEGLQGVLRDLREDEGLLLWGRPGAGKTYAMAALAREYMLAGYDVQRTGFEMLLLRIRDTYKPTARETEMGIVKPLIEANKLFIEDVGTTVRCDRQESDFSLRTFLVLLDQRLEACRPTFVTTNKPVEQLASSFDDRIASRLIQACRIVKLEGRDRRQTPAGPEPARSSLAARGDQSPREPPVRCSCVP
jgi:DNA replication protein DnaC